MVCGQLKDFDFAFVRVGLCVSVANLQVLIFDLFAVQKVRS